MTRLYMVGFSLATYHALYYLAHWHTFFLARQGKVPTHSQLLASHSHVFRFERPFSASSGLAIYFTSAYRRIVAVTSEQWFQDAL